MIFLEIAAALIIVLFVYASLSKFLAFHKFIGDIHNQPLPKSWKPILVWVIPRTELVLSALLIFDKSRLIGYWGSTIFMGMFTIYASVILLHGFSYVPCSCGGVIENLTWGQHLVLNVFYTGLSVLGIVFQRQKNTARLVASTKTIL